MAKARAKAVKSASRSGKMDRETLLWTGILVALIVFMVSSVAYRWYKALPPRAEDLEALAVKVGEVQEYLPMTDNSHLGDEGSNPNYNSDPPTSGPHYDSPAQAGFYTVPQTPEVLVANLEQGDVVIYYSPRTLSAEDQERLKALMERYNAGETHKVLVVPHGDEKYPVIVTAWTRVLRLTAYEEAKVNQFIRRFLGQGPGHRQ